MAETLIQTPEAVKDGRETVYVKEITNLKPRKAYDFFKRAFDLLAALFLLIILFVPMLIVTIIVYIDSPGNPFFLQERLGKNQKPFMMIKFRSMKHDAEKDGPRWADENDERCTPFGRIMRKTRIDELPQIINVILGDMSFVGPRPERSCFYDEFDEYIIGFRQRTLVTPGITGWAQVNGGYDLLPEEKIVYDIEYIENRSALMDIRCLFKTVKVVFTHHGAR